LPLGRTFEEKGGSEREDTPGKPRIFSPQRKIGAEFDVDIKEKEEVKKKSRFREAGTYKKSAS